MKMQRRKSNLILNRTIALIVLWSFLPAPLGVYDIAGFSDAAFALRPKAAIDRPKNGFMPVATTAVSLKDALEERPGAFSVLSQFFRETLASVNENPEELVKVFEEAINAEAKRRHERMGIIRQGVLDKLAYIAQDPGAPFNSPPECWYYIANYLYLRLEGKAINEICQAQGMVGNALKRRLEFLANEISGKDLTDPKVREQLSRTLEQRFGGADQALRGQVRFNYKSLLYREGARYLSVDIMTGADRELADGVKSDLLISIPVRPGAKPEYQTPYQLGKVAVGSRAISVSLFDPLDFLKKNYRGRAQEAGLVSEREIYGAWQKEFEEAQALAKHGKVEEANAKLRVLVRPSLRAGNAHEAGIGFFNAIVNDDTVLAGHIVHKDSECHYTNQTVITAPGNIVAALFKAGRLGEVIWSFEADHSRAENGSESELGRVAGVLDGMARGGVHSGITIDATPFINKDEKEGQTPEEKAKEKYSKAFEHMRWQLQYLQNALRAQEAREPGSVFFPDLKDWYVEVDLAMDMVDHTPYEMRYIAEGARKLREDFGCAVSVVPGIGFTHGPTAVVVKDALLKELVGVARSVLGPLTGIGSHAGSGLDTNGLKLFRGQAWAINKSTEFGAILLAVLRDSEIASDRKLYNRIWDRLFDEFENNVPQVLKAAVKQARAQGKYDYARPFDYNYNEQQGTWLPADKNAPEAWLVAGPGRQREWIGLRDKNKKLVFGNDLMWGISPQAWEKYAELIEKTYRRYHGPDVMNGEGMRPAVERHLRAKQAAAAPQGDEIISLLDQAIQLEAKALTPEEALDMLQSEMDAIDEQIQTREARRTARLALVKLRQSRKVDGTPEANAVKQLLEGLGVKAATAEECVKRATEPLAMARGPEGQAGGQSATTVRGSYSFQPNKIRRTLIPLTLREYFDFLKSAAGDNAIPDDATFVMASDRTNGREFFDLEYRPEYNHNIMIVYSFSPTPQAPRPVFPPPAADTILGLIYDLVSWEHGEAMALGYAEDQFEREDATRRDKNRIEDLRTQFEDILSRATDPEILQQVVDVLQPEYDRTIERVRGYLPTVWPLEYFYGRYISGIKNVMKSLAKVKQPTAPPAQVRAAILGAI